MTAPRTAPTIAAVGFKEVVAEVCLKFEEGSDGDVEDSVGDVVGWEVVVGDEIEGSNDVVGGVCTRIMVAVDTFNVVAVPVLEVNPVVKL